MIIGLACLIDQMILYLTFPVLHWFKFCSKIRCNLYVYFFREIDLFLYFTKFLLYVPKMIAFFQFNFLHFKSVSPFQRIGG